MPPRPPRRRLRLAIPTLIVPWHHRPRGRRPNNRPKRRARLHPQRMAYRPQQPSQRRNLRHQRNRLRLAQQILQKRAITRRLLAQPNQPAKLGRQPNPGHRLHFTLGVRPRLRRNRPPPRRQLRQQLLHLLPQFGKPVPDRHLQRHNRLSDKIPTEPRPMLRHTPPNRMTQVHHDEREPLG